MNHIYTIVYITVPDMQTGERIAQALIEKKLAACVNLTPVHSIYTWQEKLERDEEVLLIVKTRADLFAEKLIPAVQAMHPYQVPEIIALPIVAGLPEYLSWIDEETGSD